MKKFEISTIRGSEDNKQSTSTANRKENEQTKFSFNSSAAGWDSGGGQSSAEKSSKRKEQRPRQNKLWPGQKGLWAGESRSSEEI